MGISLRARELTSGITEGSTVTRGQLIARNGLTTDRRNNHLQLSYMFNDYTLFRDHRCWVEHLDLSSKRSLLDDFDSVRNTEEFMTRWETASEEGMNAYKELLNKEIFPQGPQLCYALGLDVRVPIITPVPTATPKPAQTATPRTTSPPTPTSIPFLTPTSTSRPQPAISETQDDCGNAVGNGDEIIPGPSTPEDGDRDSVFRSLTVHPADPQITLMGTERNGFVKSTDGRVTWTRHRRGLRWSPGIGYPEIYDIAISPSDPKIVYAATTGLVVYRSADAGQRGSPLDYSL